MGTDLSAVVIGFANADEAVSAMNEGVYRLTNIHSEGKRLSKEVLEVIRENTEEIFHIHLGYDETTPHIVISSTTRWYPQELSRYKRFIEEIKMVFPSNEIILLNEYASADLDSTTLSEESLNNNIDIFRV